MERGNSMGKCMEVWARVAYREMLVLAVTRTRVAQDISAYGNVVVGGGDHLAGQRSLLHSSAVLLVLKLILPTLLGCA